jgi:hypothetical protein
LPQAVDELAVPFIMSPCASALNEQDLLLHVLILPTLDSARKQATGPTTASNRMSNGVGKLPGPTSTYTYGMAAMAEPRRSSCMPGYSTSGWTKLVFDLLARVQ